MLENNPAAAGHHTQARRLAGMGAAGRMDDFDGTREMVEALKVAWILTNKWTTLFWICELAAGSKRSWSGAADGQSRTAAGETAAEDSEKRMSMGVFWHIPGDS
jgi:hypothetical protein